MSRVRQYLCKSDRNVGMESKNLEATTVITNFVPQIAEHNFMHWKDQSERNLLNEAHENARFMHTKQKILSR